MQCFKNNIPLNSANTTFKLFFLLSLPTKFQKQKITLLKSDEIERECLYLQYKINLRKNLMKRFFFLFTALLFMGIGYSIAQNRTITGVVISEEDGEPVIGASVVIPGTTIGTVTNIDGEFTLPNVPTNATTVRFSYIGMETLDLPISDAMNVTMKMDTGMLEEVVVLGYGTAKKLGSVVGSVSTVGAAKLKNQPTSNFSDALQGQVAGLSVLSSSGEPSQTASIRLRGINSITADTTPLFILDGSPVQAIVFNSMNPSDIENITVLKDASSTAIYGSRAANGVIVITSRKGKMNQDAIVNIKAQYGVSNLIGDRVNMMNASQYFQFREMLTPGLLTDEAWVNRKKITLDNGIDTDWSDYVFKDNTPTYTIDASIMGGGNNSNYFISMSHNDTEGIAPLSEMQRSSLRVNLEARAKDWLRLGANTNLAYMRYNENPDVNQTALVNPATFARLARPDDSPYYYTLENGIAKFGDRADYLTLTQAFNPFYYEEIRGRMRENVSLNLNLYEEIRPINGLVVRAAQSLDAFDYSYTSTVAPIKNSTTPMGDKIELNNGVGSAMESYQRYYNFTFTNTAEYKFSVENTHHATILVGQEALISKNRSLGVSGQGTTDPKLTLISHTTQISTPTLNIAENVFNSAFFRVDYSYNDKYNFDVSYRVDGSSRFAKNHRWAEFYSVGAKWNVAKEAFMKQYNWLNDLDIRVSYGTTGNSSIGNYASIGYIDSVGNYYGGNAIDIAQPSNPELTWETVSAANFGLDFRVFNRLSGTVEFYNKKTTDMLMSIPYSASSTGFAYAMGNIGSMRNMGVDLTFNVDLLQEKDLYWGVRIAANYNKNKILELFNGQDEYVIPNTSIKLQVGKPYGEFYTTIRKGVDPRDGKQIWLDQYGNETKTYSEDYAVFTGKQRYAPWTGGFGTDFQYKNFSMNADFSFALGKYMFNNDRYFFENPNAFGSSYNQSESVLNMWTTPGQVTDIPAGSEQLQMDSHLLENASFLRLKALALNYSLPEKWLNKTRFFRTAKIFAVGRNLFTVTKYTGYDPEPDVNISLFGYPNTRQYVFGVEVTF